MDIVIMIIAATVILGFLVFIHEGGHFVAARAFGVRVTEFMIGLPAPNIGFTFKGTRFGVTCLPLGGYASVCGMVVPEQPPSLLKRILELVHTRGSVYLEDVMQEFELSEDDAYSALESLSEMGSIVRPLRRDKVNIYRAPKVSGENGFDLGQARPVDDARALFESEVSQQYFALPFWRRCVILAAGPLMNLLFAILAFVIIYSVLGVDLQNTTTGEIVHYTLDPFKAVQAGFNYIGMVFVAILGLFNPATAAETVSNSTSVVGIAVMSKSAFEAGFTSVLSFSAIISVSLGLMNLLPIMPLDGGRLLVEVVQRISRRTLSIRIQNYFSIAGIVLFTGFFLIMVNQDVQRFVFGNWG